MSLFKKRRKWDTYNAARKLIFLFTSFILLCLCSSTFVVGHYYHKKTLAYHEKAANSTEQAFIDRSEEVFQWLLLCTGGPIFVLTASLALLWFLTNPFIVRPLEEIISRKEKELDLCSENDISDEIQRLEICFEKLDAKVKNSNESLWSIHAHMVRFEEISQELIKARTIESALKLLTDGCSEKFQALFAGVWLETQQQESHKTSLSASARDCEKQLALVMFSGPDFFNNEENLSIIKESLELNSVISQKDKIETNNIPHKECSDMKQWIDEQGIQSLAVYPLFFLSGTSGVFALLSGKKYEETEFHVFKLLSHLISVVVSNLRLTSELLTFSEELQTRAVNHHKPYTSHNSDNHRGEEESASAQPRSSLEQDKAMMQISYDVRTALNTIIGTAELLFKTDLTEEQSDYLNMIENSSRELAVFIDDVNDRENSELVEADYQSKQGESLSILVVEDNHFNKKLIVAILEKAGYQVDTADNGLEAFTSFKTKRYALILMDLQMPVMGGLESARKIRQGESMDGGLQQRTPIVAMTTHAVKGYREECLQNGFDDFITKPLHLHNFNQKLEKWIQSGSSQKKQSEEKTSEILIDMHEVLNRFQGDREFFHDMLNEFLIYAPEQLHTIVQSLKEGDYELAANHVHSLKGAASNLGAKKLVYLCQSFEQVESTNKLSQAEVLVNEMEGEIEELIKYSHSL